MGKRIKIGLGFATGRKSFKKVLNAYISSWAEAKKMFPPDADVRLQLFVAYDLEYRNTQSTDYTNLSQEIVDVFDDLVFIGAKNTLKSLDRLVQEGLFSATELRSVFGSGYAGKRNAIVYAALENKVDYLLFLDDDEYPMAVTNNNSYCLWSGQHVIHSHLREIANADYTNGYHCGYISPIPQIAFDSRLTETEFRRFVEAISNDIISWDSIKTLMKSGGVTFADTAVLIDRKPHEVSIQGGCKFISGANLCLNLTDAARTFPFFNPPGARGEDTFLSTLLADRRVVEVPCYTFHDGFFTYRKLLEGVLPVQLASIAADNAKVVNRFLGACIGWVRYKPLLVYLTRPGEYEKEMDAMQATFETVLPKLAAYFDAPRFLDIMDEFLKYRKNTKKHAKLFETTKGTWVKLLAQLS